MAFSTLFSRDIAGAFVQVCADDGAAPKLFVAGQGIAGELRFTTAAEAREFADAVREAADSFA